MTEKILSFLLLITVFNCVFSIPKVTIDSSSSTTISPTGYSNNVFYIDNKSSRTTIYFYIKDVDNGLYYDSLIACNSDDNNSNCDNIGVTFTKYSEISQNSVTYYLYKFSSSYSHKYLYITYSVKSLSGSLEVQASYSDLDDLVSSLIGAALSIVAIVFIVIGSIIGLSIIITIIVCCCICGACCHRTTTVGSVGYIQPPPTVVVSNPTSSPLINQTPHYI